ncbi:MAG: YcgL domain-containing protein [Moraxellaceae bacterium]|nr:YcgL domain-containing protein [Moraxellaceae bacterium]MDZ4387397.1 YcgL domain-containing protein [Moraxellaceae bacterium]
MSRVFCSIYESSSKREMYLYVLKQEGFKRVPEPLLELMGKKPRFVTDLVLTPERKLARANVDEVIEKISADGFYLQMPPPPEPGLVHAADAPAWRRQGRNKDSESLT